MKRLLAILALLCAAILAPTPAYAHHGMIGAGMECGTYEWDGVGGMTKGRTDGVVYRVDHQVGCARVILSNLSPAGNGEMQGNQGQMDRGVRYGQEDAARTFDYVFHIKVDPSSIPVRLTNYSGAD